MTRTRVIFLFLTLVLFPGFVSADSFHQVEGGTVFQSRDRAYRVRSVTKPIQLAEVTAGLLGPSQMIGEALFTFFDGTLSQTNEGLQYAQTAVTEQIAQPTFVERDSEHFLIGQVGTSQRIWHFVSGQWRPTVNVPQDGALVPEQLAQTNNQTTLIAASAGQALVYRLIGEAWVLADTTPCPAVSRYVHQPISAIFCTDGASWTLSATGWEPLLGESALFRAVSAELIVATSVHQPNRLFIIEADAFHTLELTATPPPTAFFAVGRRVLLGFAATGLSELLWESDPVSLLPVAASYTRVVEAGNATGAILVSAGTVAYLSAATGVWQALTSLGDFNNARRVVGGWWFWQTNETLTTGGLAQFLADGQSVAVKVNPWASTTSPIQAAFLDQLPAYVSVVTNSGTGNVNLYRSQDYVAWSRLTLPTSPTLVRTIGEARELPAGTLVETTGVVSVPAGVVGGDTVYIQDASGGIQVFLSASKGAISQSPPMLLRVTGEISSSQVSRIVLDQLDDLVALGLSTPAEVVAAAAVEIDQYQGRLVLLRDRVTDLATDYLFLEPELKLHFDLLAQNIKNVFRVGDRIEVTGVADWNSSTSQTEVWYTGQGYTLIDRLPVAAASPKSTKSTTAAAPKKSASSAPSSAARSAVVAVSKSSAARPLVQGIQTTSPAPPTSPTAGPHQPSTMILTFLGFLGGMLAIQGRRFRALIR